MITNVLKFILPFILMGGVVGELTYVETDDDRFRNKTEWNHNYSEVGGLYVEWADKIFCSCVLIEEDVLLTAAHCLDDEFIAETMTVQLIGKQYEVESWEQHPTYGTSQFKGDIGIIFLTDPVEGYISPAELGTTPITFQDYGWPITQVGYGGDGKKRGTDPGSTYIFGSGVGTDWMLWDCFGTQVNPGDSGGAVFKSGKLVGITVAYFKNREDGRAWMNVAVRVDLHIEWIEEKIDNHRTE